MPHCVLEYSNNVVDEPDFGVLFGEIHEFLAGTVLFQLGDIKSRAVKHELFRVGDGAPDRAFVAVEIHILEGRDDEVKVGISQGVMAILQRHYTRTCDRMRCSISVRVSEMERVSYARVTSKNA